MRSVDHTGEELKTPEGSAAHPKRLTSELAIHPDCENRPLAGSMSALESTTAPSVTYSEQPTFSCK